MTQHELKILPEYFVAVRDGIKKFEVRKDDRLFEVGDILCLHEINCGVLTGRTIKAEVTYVLRHPEYCKEGYCILSIKVAEQQNEKQLAEWLEELRELRGIVAASNVLAKDALAVDTLCKQILEYKRLLKLAVEDLEELHSEADCSCNCCKGEKAESCQFIKCWTWRYADEALKLIGGTEA